MILSTNSFPLSISRRFPGSRMFYKLMDRNTADHRLASVYGALHSYGREKKILGRNPVLPRLSQQWEYGVGGREGGERGESGAVYWFILMTARNRK